jgi:hypothetical protein
MVGARARGNAAADQRQHDVYGEIPEGADLFPG